VSATTRAPRDGEVDGRQYHFWTRERFEEEIRREAFLEWALVHGQYYGSLKQEVEPYRNQGIGVLLEIDVQGAEQVRRRCPDNVSIFLCPPSLEVLESRLRGRRSETEASIERRLRNARAELARRDEYTCQVVNDDLERATNEIREILHRLFEPR
jgi:guanylate kinase